MKKILKWIGIVLGVLVLLLVLAVGAVYAMSGSRLNKSYDVQPEAITVPTDEETIALGKRLFQTRGCIDCHGSNLAGAVVMDDPAAGLIVGANLTSGQGGVGAIYSDLDFVRAIRHGIDPDGKPLVFMPADEYYFLSDEDLGAIIAYIKSVPPVDREPPAPAPGPLMRVLFLAGEVPILASAERIAHDAPRPTAPEPGVTLEYGQYLANGCIGCHGEGFSGGPIQGGPPDWPPAANLTPDPQTGLGTWSEADFFRAIREGLRPDGSTINPVMPWQNFGQMTDEELSAIWLYLQSVPSKPFGN